MGANQESVEDSLSHPNQPDRHGSPQSYANGSGNDSAIDNEEFDLENAIGDVFNSLGYATDANIIPKVSKEPDIETGPSEDAEFDLESAIGNAFAAVQSKEKNLQNKDINVNNNNENNSNNDDNNNTNKDNNDVGTSQVNADTNNEVIGTDANIENLDMNAIDHEDNKGDESQINNLRDQANSQSNELDVELGDLDLEAAIGNAFSEITNKDNQEQYQPHNQEKVRTPQDMQVGPQELDSDKVINTIESNEEAKNDEQVIVDDLDAVIGNALKSLTENKIENEDIAPESQSESRDVALSNEDEDLEAAIGNAFKNLTKNEGFTEVREETVQTKEDKNDHQLSAENQNDELHAVISASLKSLISEGKTNDSISKSISEKDHQQNENKKNFDKDNEDLDIENAINEAFKSANLPSKFDDRSVELGSNSNFDNNVGISEDALQELAMQITHQVQGETLKKKQPQQIDEMPQIDDNILQHFQNQAHKEDTNDDSNQQLSDVIANAVRNAMEVSQTTQENSSTNAENEVADLDSLRMNDILQNALNMAMENPHDLLSNLDIDDEISASSMFSSNSIANALSKLSHPLPTSTSAFLKSLSRSQDIDLSRKAEAPRKKSLSIAETLALHRQSMSGARRDYSSIESMDQIMRNDHKGPFSGSNVPLNTQISKALSSISSHISSGTTGGEANLLQVIRQMTNSLSNSKGYTFTSGIPTVHEIISSYKDRESLEGITSALKTARRYLESNQSIDADIRAVSLIDNVLGLFSASPFTSSTGVSLASPPMDDIKPEAILSIRDSVISSVSNFTNSKYWKVSMLLGEKPKSDTPEYKERIRLENRERKKKWREENAERNKDNDLRSRVIKRANSMYGDADTPEKKLWIENEFQKRRAKRVAKQKKDEEIKSKNEFFGSTINNHRENPLLANQTLTKRVTDIFNLLSGTTQNIDPQAALAATSVATASVAATYANSIGASIQDVSSAVSSIITTIMDSTPSMGSKDRLLSLSKGLSSVLKLGQKSGSNVSKQEDNILGYGEKRKPTGFISPQPKRISPGPSSLGIGRSSLKIPQFKKPSGTENSIASPFISHKVGTSNFDNEVPTSTTGATFIKPSNFQRPSFTKPDPKNVGFPQLFSTSFKSS